MNPLTTFTIFGLICLGQAQFFDPILDDKTYLDKVEEQIQAEVEDSALELLEQSKIAEKSTKAFIEVKLRENVFQALRTIAEAELSKNELSASPGPFVQHRVGRKDEEDGDTAELEPEGDDDGTTTKASTETNLKSEKDKDKTKVQGAEAQGEGEEEEIPVTTELNGLATAVKINQNVFNFLGEAVKTVFQGLGGGTPVKATYPRNEYETGPGTEELVEALPVLQRRPYGEQLVGLLNLFSSHRPQLQNQIKPLSQGFGSRVNTKISHFLYGNKNKEAPVQLVQVVNNKNKPTQKKATVDENITAGVDPKIISYIDNLKSAHPYLLPDLYRGIDGANRFLESMNKVVDGITKEIPLSH